MGAPLTLRPYQLRAVSQLRDAFGRVRRVLLVLPTGGGKTHTAAELIRAAWAKGRRVLFLVHRREIVLDTARRLRAANVPCGVLMADEPRTEGPVQVASVGTIAAREEHPEADFLIWDEAHHCDAETYRAIAALYPTARHLGLTATPERSDRRGLRDAFDELVVGSTIRELTELGALAPIDVIAPGKRQSKLSATPFEAWQAHAGRRPTVAFCSSITASKLFVEQLLAVGVCAAHLDGKTPKSTRDRILSDFAAGRLEVLSNVDVLTEGWDCARAKVCLLARGTDAVGPYLQMVGRVLRVDDNDPTARALLIDLCGVVHQHLLPGAHREWTLDGLRKRAANDNDDAIRQCAECGRVYLARQYLRACPNGHPHPVKPERAVKPAALAAVTRVTDRRELQAEFDRLSRLARVRSWKPGAVPVLFKKRFGFWPRGMREQGAAA